MHAVPFRGKERISFKQLISMKKPGETSLFKVLREGREYTFRINYKSVCHIYLFSDIFVIRIL